MEAQARELASLSWAVAFGIASINEASLIKNAGKESYVKQDEIKLGRPRSGEMADDILLLHDAGLNQKEIQEKVGCAASYVWRVLTKNGRVCVESGKHAVKQYEDGVLVGEYKSVREAVRVTGVSRDTIAKCCAENRTRILGSKYIFRYA